MTLSPPPREGAATNTAALTTPAAETSPAAVVTAAMAPPAGKDLAVASMPTGVLAQLTAGPVGGVRKQSTEDTSPPSDQAEVPVQEEQTASSATPSAGDTVRALATSWEQAIDALFMAPEFSTHFLPALERKSFAGNHSPAGAGSRVQPEAGPTSVLVRSSSPSPALTVAACTSDWSGLQVIAALGGLAWVYYRKRRPTQSPEFPEMGELSA
ncbi:MAG: hypothetical protein JO112_07670 [Planctomycetes bacterium]|nr:hypothetical protein [Planctomycetota bacterium]